ncbi:CaiB/BaiF CoA transferase family protein [Ottowia sp. VDI28]|uniref:CaiB/BaiF CoA transferase family protein n=1 Tax=Ottowia sp. VDI28 TaxID=3133968 RepID=UPI003C2B2EE5
MTNPSSGTASSGPLEGVRVLDLTTVFMGPSCTQLLADLGADVIKIEAPRGDSVRAIGPYGDKGLGPLFLGLNRNKRSVVMDLKKPEGVAALMRLAQDADVFATNIRPAAMRRLGVGYEQLSAINPRLIYASMVGFSQRGPYAGKAAYDDMIQAATGLPAIVAESTGDAPRYLPVTIADRSVGLYAFGVICAALHARNQTGVGQSVDIPMFETMIPYVLGDHLYGHTFVPEKAGFGYPRLMTRHRRPYKTKDGYVCCLIYHDRQWTLFLDALGKGDLMKTDPRLRDIRTRTQAIDELYQFVSDELAQRSTEEWRQLLPQNEIPIFPMHTFETLLEDEHLASTGFFQETEHPVVGKIRETAVPSEWSGTPPGRRMPAPSLGEHTVQVLAEAGFSPAEIELLLANRAVHAGAAAPEEC